MILSFAMAEVLFYSIAGKDILTSPTPGSTLESIPIVAENLDSSLELSGVPKSATVGLIGPSLDIHKVNFTKDYQIYLDLADYEKGEYTVNLRSRNFPETLRVMPVSSILKVKLSSKVDATLGLGYRFINEEKSDTEYSVSVEEMAETSVILRASQEALQKVVRAEANTDVADRTEAFEQDAKIKAYDANDKELNVEISLTTIHVKCNVASYSKVVPVQAQFVGDISTEYEISNYRLSQSQITIYGLEEKIKDISVVKVDVDVSDVRSNTTVTNVAFKRGNSINKFFPETVDVTVEVEKVTTEKIEKVPTKVLNNAENYKVSFVGEGGYATVSVTGTEAKIASLTTDNIQVSVDVDGLRVGTRHVDMKTVVNDEGIKIELLSPSKVTINVGRN